MSIGPIKPSETGVTPPPIEPEKQHPITKMFQKVCTFVRSPIQTLRGRTVTIQSVPIISQKKLGEIIDTLKTKYGITPSNKDITSLEALVNKDQTPTKSFLDTELLKDEAGRIIMAAHLLRAGKSASVGDALKRAKGRLHKFTMPVNWNGLRNASFSSGCTAAGLSAFGAFVVVVSGLVLWPIAPVALIVAGSLFLGAPIIGLVTAGVVGTIGGIPLALSHRFIKKWEGTDPQVQKIHDVSKKTVPTRTSEFQDNVRWNLYSNLSNSLRPPLAQKEPHTVWIQWCKDFEAAVKEEQKKIDQQPLVISTPADTKAKDVSELSNNFSKRIEDVTALKNFLDPPKDTEEQKLQLDWHTKDWKLIREKLKKQEFEILQKSLYDEKKRIREGQTVHNFKNVAEQTEMYLDTIRKALTELHNSPHLNEFLQNIETENSFYTLMEFVNKGKHERQKIKIPARVLKPVQEDLVCDWSYIQLQWSEHFLGKYSREHYHSTTYPKNLDIDWRSYTPFL